MPIVVVRPLASDNRISQFVAQCIKLDTSINEPSKPCLVVEPNRFNKIEVDNSTTYLIPLNSFRNPFKTVANKIITCKDMGDIVNLFSFSKDTNTTKCFCFSKKYYQDKGITT